MFLLVKSKPFSVCCIALILVWCLTASFLPIKAQNNGLPPNITISSIAWSPDGTRLVSGHFGGFVRIIDVATSETLFELPSGSQPVGIVTWSPNGSMIASANHNGTIQIRDAATGSLQQEMTSDRGIITGLLWNHDNQHIISSAGETGTLQVWEIMSGALIERHEGGSIGQMVWSPDINHVLLARLGAVIILNAAMFEREAMFEMPERTIVTTNGGDVTAIAWHPDGNRVASGSLNGQVRLWDVQTGEMIDEVRGNYAPVMGSFETAIRSVYFNLDGTQLTSVSSDGTVRTWDIETLRLVSDSKTDEHISAAAWSADGCQLAYGINTAFRGHPDEDANLFGIMPFC